MHASYVFVGLAILLFLWSLSYSASRLDRMHHRVETSWEHLDALLQRRAAIAIEIAHGEGIDPASSLMLMGAAFQAREAAIVERSEAESGLSESLKLMMSDPAELAAVSPQLIDELKQITDKIRIAVTIHLEAVNTTRALRKKLSIRLFRLSGSAPLPVKYAFEDDVL